MNPHTLKIIAGILQSGKQTHVIAGCLAKQFGIPNGDIISDIILADPKIIINLPELEDITSGKLRQITLLVIALLPDREKLEVIEAARYVVEAYEWLCTLGDSTTNPCRRLKILDHNLHDAFNHLIGNRTPWGQCPNCPVKTSNPDLRDYFKRNGC